MTNFDKGTLVDVRSLTGRNIDTIKEETSLDIRAGVTSHLELSTWMVYNPPDGEDWRLPLLTSLLAVRDSGWEISFNDEDEALDNTSYSYF